MKIEILADGLQVGDVGIHEEELAQVLSPRLEDTANDLIDVLVKRIKSSLNSFD